MAYRWYKVGLARNLFAVGGLLIGIIIGLVIAPSIMAWFIDPIGKYAAVVLCVCICTFALGSLGELIGNKLNIRLSSKTSQKINAYAGSFGSIIFLLIFVWLSAAIISYKTQRLFSYSTRDYHRHRRLSRGLMGWSSRSISLKFLLVFHKSLQILWHRLAPK